MWAAGAAGTGLTRLRALQFPRSLAGMLTFTAGAAAPRGSMETRGRARDCTTALEVGQAWRKKIKNFFKISPPLALGKYRGWPLAQEAAGGLLVCLWNSGKFPAGNKAGWGKSQGHGSARARPEGQRLGSSTRSHREHLGSRWVFWPSSKAF